MRESRNEDADKYARLADLISWMFYPDRRPGLLGTAERIVGTAGGRPAELRRSSDGWALVIEGRQERVFTDAAAALEVIPEHAFSATSVVVTARIAPLLFQGAVEHAEEALTQYWEALAITVRSNIEMSRKAIESNFLERILAVPLSDPIDFSLTTGLLDRSVRRSMSAIILAISARLRPR